MASCSPAVSHTWHTVQMCLQLFNQHPYFNFLADLMREAGGVGGSQRADKVSVFSEGRAGLHKVDVIHPLALSPLMGLGVGDSSVTDGDTVTGAM